MRKFHVISWFAPMLAYGLRGRPQYCLDIAESFEQEECEGLAAGIIDEVYVAQRSDITTFGTEAVAPDSSNLGKITTAHTFAVDKKWIRIEIEEKKGKYEYEGPKDGQGNFKVKLSGKVIGDSDKINSLVNALSRKKVVAIGVNRDKNMRYHLGTEGMLARINFNGSTEESGSDSHGQSFEITAEHPRRLTYGSDLALETY